MSDERKALEELNELFYKALETLDMDAMERIWLHEGWVRCIHPGWDVLVGWHAVRHSWEEIFKNTRWMRVTPTSVDVRTLGEVGIVACSENITAKNEEDIGVAVAQATNVYQKGPSGWKLVLHHASQAPVRVTQPFSGRVQ